MPVIRDQCPTCSNQKDNRARQCRACQFRFNHPRQGTGADWRVHKGTGYVARFIDGRWQYQHRFVVEQSIGRRLTRKEHVHHKNGDKADNRLENLELVTATEHAKQHSSSDRMRMMSLLGHAARWGSNATNL
jgi:hypothetical protein